MDPEQCILEAMELWCRQCVASSRSRLQEYKQWRKQEGYEPFVSVGGLRFKGDLVALIVTGLARRGGRIEEAREVLEKGLKHIWGVPQTETITHEEYIETWLVMKQAMNLMEGKVGWNG